MTGYIVAWGCDDASGEQLTAEITTVTEMDAVLDGIAASADWPQMVDICPTKWTGLVPPGLQLGIGHAGRTALTFADADDSAVAVDPALPLWPEPLGFDYGGQRTEVDPERLSVTPETAREAARHYVETGHRPTCVAWR